MILQSSSEATMVYDTEAIRKTYNEIADREDGFEKIFPCYQLKRK